MKNEVSLSPKTCDPTFIAASKAKRKTESKNK
jgi:hypothetical protein